MIVVQTLSEFLSFIDMAKQQNISYSIIGSEKEGFEGVLVPDKRNNKFYGKCHAPHGACELKYEHNGTLYHKIAYVTLPTERVS